jgi:hypothetical protein
MDKNNLADQQPGQTLHPIWVESRRKSADKLQSANPKATLLDVTSRGSEPWVKFSPFFPHGSIPIPFTEADVGQSVEGIWQGLKVFEKAGIDPSKWGITSMRGIKRSSRTLGKILGHQTGPYGEILLSYIDARHQIYLPIYNWLLTHRLQKEVQQIQELRKANKVILLDYETNIDVENLSKPLSHAGLIVAYLKSIELKGSTTFSST